jgi:hypothetical protein
MKAFGWHVVKVVVISFILLQSASFILLFSFRSSSFYKTSLPFIKRGEHYDFAIIGSSRGLTSFDTKKLSHTLQQRGFNFSVDDTHIGSHLLMVKHLLHYKMSFDTLFLVYENSLDSINQISTNDYRFLPFIHKDYVKEYFQRKQATTPLTASAYFPFLALSYYNVEMLFPSVFAIFKPEFRYKYDSNGDYDYPNDKTVEVEGVGRQLSLNFDNGELCELRELCEDHGIELILLLTPNYNSTYKFSGDAFAYDFLDLSKSISQPHFFYDEIHLNKTGKDLLTDVVLSELKYRREDRLTLLYK